MPIEHTAGRQRWWATGIWTDESVEIEPLPSDYGVPRLSTPAGAYTAGLLHPEGIDPIAAVSLYAAFDDDTTAEKLVGDLEPILTACSERLIIGGDFNAWDQYADGWEVRWRGVWSRLEDAGLINLLKETRSSRTSLPGCRCGLGEGCWHVQTVRRSSRALTDYLWASPDLIDGCKVDVMDINDPELIGVSDHSPVWADLSIE